MPQLQLSIDLGEPEKPVRLMNRIHPLIGIYSKNILAVLKKAIDANELKMMCFISNIKHQLIPILDAKRHLFKNINSVAELNELNINLS